MEFINLIGAIASHVSADNIEVVCEMLEKLIIIGEQMEAAAAKAIAQANVPAQSNQAAQQ